MKDFMPVTSTRMIVTCDTQPALSKAKCSGFFSPLSKSPGRYDNFETANPDELRISPRHFLKNIT